MKPDIRAKLQSEIRQPIRSERQVVYVLVEIRKLLELRARNLRKAKKPRDHTYATLEFCCDWAVHPIIDWENGRRIVRRFNEYEQFLHEIEAGDGRHSAENAEPPILEQIRELVGLEQFRKQLSQFLKLWKLSPGLAADSRRWCNFLSYYAGVIEDCPLSCREEGLEYADEVTVKVVHSSHKPAAADIPLELIIRWEWISKKTGHSCVEQFSA